MAILFIALLLFINVPAFAQDSEADEIKEIKPLYALPEESLDSEIAPEEREQITSFTLVGGDEGLFKVTSGGSALPVWKGGRVDQILTLKLPDFDGEEKPCFMLRTSKGIFVTWDLENFEERNEGLPFLTVKKFVNGETTLVKQSQELKDLCANPLDNREIVTATKDNVFYSRDGGLTWKNIGSMSRSTPGVKAAAVATINGESVVFMSHPIFGLSYYIVDREHPAWIDVAAGFEKMESLTSPDEIADILPVVRTREDGTNYTELYISQTYFPRIYKFNWENKKGELIYSGTDFVDTIDGLTSVDDVLLYTHLEGFGSMDINDYTSPGKPVEMGKWSKIFAGVPGSINTAWISQNRSGFGKGISLNELWLLYPGSINTPYAEKANGRKCIYASAYQCRTKEGIEKFKKVIKDRNMNGIVIDMKDDYGLLRYDSKDPMILQKGAISTYALDLNKFIEEFKKENIYLVARIVTFKDRTLTKYNNGKYAVWDAKTNKPWVGIKGYEDIKNEDGEVIDQKVNYYDENWVDPYSEEVWEYNVQIAKELIARGFDEIQFDYIRFPTDGLNLKNAQYRWRNKGMDKESALISFLSYARENIDAPIGIDIYGANGWYRSGTRTGQDAEMLSEYVDVIGPMFYPSHFEQNFLNYAPLADRTYRIYYYGSYRNTILCRNRAIIRPWVQSFYLNVSYDRLYYDSDYIKKEFYGTRDSIDRGYMCWNNSGEYGVTPADIGPKDVFPGTAPEANGSRKPAIGNAMKPLYVDSDVSILDSILFPTYEEEEARARSEKSFVPFLRTAAQQ